MAKQIRYPTTFTAVDNGGWTTPGNVAGSDNTYATCDVDTSNNISTLFSGFGFNIPSSDITSVKLFIEHKISGNTFNDELRYTIYNEGVQVEYEAYTPVPTADTLIEIDITSYFTDAELNNDELSVKAYAFNSFTGRTFYIDTMYVEVDYVRVPSKAFGQII